MRLSTIIAASMGALALAAPVEKEKRVYVTDIVVKYFTVTVTAGMPTPAKHERPVSKYLIVLLSCLVVDHDSNEFESQSRDNRVVYLLVY